MMLCAQVTLLGVSKMMDKCIKGRKQQSRLNPRANYACFEDRHFEPFVVTTQPYEGLSHATLEWLKENQHLCDVLQVCSMCSLLSCASVNACLSSECILASFRMR
jgi:hypothetical protein